jgi:hypothetical protein
MHTKDFGIYGDYDQFFGDKCGPMETRQSLTRKIKNKIIKRQHAICAICWRAFTQKSKVEMSHIIPQSYGAGINLQSISYPYTDYPNAFAAHRKCNRMMSNYIFFWSYEVARYHGWDYGKDEYDKAKESFMGYFTKNGKIDTREVWPFWLVNLDGSPRMLDEFNENEFFTRMEASYPGEWFTVGKSIKRTEKVRQDNPEILNQWFKEQDLTIRIPLKRRMLIT